MDDAGNVKKLTENFDNIGLTDVSDMEIDDADLRDVNLMLSCTQTPASLWTDQQKKIMMDHVNYYLNLIDSSKQMIEEINKCWQDGPIEVSEVNTPQKPKSKLSFMYLAKEVDSTKNNINKPKMSDSDFLRYLESKLIPEQEYVSCPQIEMPKSSLDAIQNHLKARYVSLKNTKNTELSDHIKLGAELSQAKKLFYSLNKNPKIIWHKWISDTVKISKRYADKHISIYKFIHKFPKLKNLSISFKELYGISNRIKILFATEKNIADKWK